MHYEAEYGPASHWAYKDRMRASLSSKTASQATAAAEEAHSPQSIAAADSTAAGSARGTQAAAPPQPLVSGPLPRVVAQAAERDARTAAAAQPAAAAPPPAAGQPVICVDEGHICDGVVLDGNGDGGTGRDGRGGDGAMILVAMTKRARWAPPREPSGPLLAAEYAALHAHACGQGWTAAGQQDQALEVRQFRRFSPGTYVYVDRFGHVHQFCSLSFTSVREAEDEVADVAVDTDAASEKAEAAGGSAVSTKGTGAGGRAAERPGAAGKMDASEVKGSRIGRWEKFRVAGQEEAGAAAAAVDSERVVRLRAALEWGRASLQDAQSMPASRRELFQLTGAQELLERTRADSIDAAATAGSAVIAAGTTSDDGGGSAAPPAMMKVMVFMIGIAEVPRGSTAADMVELFGRVDITAEGEEADDAPVDPTLLNVNNELVPADTVLLPGDLVVLSSQLLSNV